MKSVTIVNKFKSRKEWKVYVWKKITEGLAKTNSVPEIERSLDMLLTAHEKEQMIKRVAAISFIKQGKSYREIGRILWLSPTTINAIRKSIRMKKGYISDYMHNKKPEKKQKRLTKKELEQLLFTIWVDSLFTLPMPPIRHPKLMRQLGYKPFRPRK